VRITFESPPDPSPWGALQPRFERLATDRPDRYFLIGREASGEQIRVQLAPARFPAEPED
jgi:hypothetical protein